VAELEEANVWLQLELDTTSNIADSLQLVLDAEAEHGKRLKRCNVHLVNELRNHVEALESKVAKMDADAGESSAASEKQFDEYRAKFVESGIGAQSLRASYYGICAPIHGGAPLAYYYLRWLKSEVDFLPRVFAGMNENFVSIVHSDRRCTADGGGGGRLFGYKAALSTTEAKLREDNSYCLVLSLWIWPIKTLRVFLLSELLEQANKRAHGRRSSICCWRQPGR
jgi:hypothetical protein